MRDKEKAAAEKSVPKSSTPVEKEIQTEAAPEPAIEVETVDVPAEPVDTPADEPADVPAEPVEEAVEEPAVAKPVAKPEPKPADSRKSLLITVAMCAFALLVLVGTVAFLLTRNNGGLVINKKTPTQLYAVSLTSVASDKITMKNGLINSSSRVYVPGVKHACANFVGLEKTTHKITWSLLTFTKDPTCQEVPKNAPLMTDKLFIYDTDSEVIVRKLDTGAVVWRTNLKTQTRPILAGNQLYVLFQTDTSANAPSYVTALDMATGKAKWTSGLAGILNEQLVATDKSVFAVGYTLKNQTAKSHDSCPELARLDPATGKSIYANNYDCITATKPVTNGTPLYSNGTLYYRIDQNLLSINEDSGKITGNAKLQTDLSEVKLAGLATSNGTLYVAGLGNKVNALDTSLKTLKWSADLGGVATADPLATGGYVYVATDKQLFAIDAANGKIAWRYGISKPVVSNIIVDDGFLYYYDAQGLHTLDLAS